jgi:hypothetical protein
MAWWVCCGGHDSAAVDQCLLPGSYGSAAVALQLWLDSYGLMMWLGNILSETLGQTLANNTLPLTRSKAEGCGMPVQRAVHM